MRKACDGTRGDKLSKSVLNVGVVLTGILLGILHYTLKPAPSQAEIGQYAENMSSSTEWQGQIAPDEGAIQKEYGVSAFPTTILIGGDGKVQFYEAGALENAEVAF
jgi:hypothetical protein